MFALNICCCLGQFTSGLLQFSFMCWLFNDSMQNCSRGCGFQCAKLLLVGAAASIIFVATKHVFCRDKNMLVVTIVLSRFFKNYFVAKKHLSRKIFAAANIILSRQKFCCVKHTFVATKDVFCRDIQAFFAKNTCLSRQK